MSTGTIKSLQVSGSTVEVLAVDQSDGSAHRLQTDGKLASLITAMQQATQKASEIKTKPEIYEGLTFDFTLVAAVIEPLTKEEQIKADIRQARRDEDQRLRLAAYSPELQQQIIDADMVDEL